MVRILADGEVLGETAVDENGNWYLEAILESGEPVIEVQSVDSGGNIIAITPSMTVTVVSAQKVAATPDLVLNETNLYVGNVELGGSGEPGQQIVFFVAGVEIGRTAVAEDGIWNLPLDLEAGSHTVDLQTVDANGAVVNEAGPFEIAVQEAILPTVSLPVSDVFTGGMTLSGTGQPGTRVRLFANEIAIGDTDVDDNGNYTVEVNLAVGRYNIDVATLDKNGQAQQIVPALSLPVLALNEPELEVADGSGPTMETPDLDDSGKGAVSGTADPNAIVTVTANGKLAGITSADSNGNWTVIVDLGAGSFEVQAQVLDTEGNVLLSSPKQTVNAGETAEIQEADHVIDAANAAGEYTTLLAGLEAAGLTTRLADVDKAFTLFAPTDAAFDALPEQIIETWNENPEAYKEILFYLVLEGAYTTEELIDAEVLTTLAGINIGITTDDDQVMINGVPIEATIPAGNSVVYAIDQLILPPLGYQAQPPIINTSGVSIFTGDYLTVVGTAEPGTSILLQVSGENFGDLAPVNDAGSWQVSDDIASGVHEILAYMVDENGLLMAISQPVSLPVQ